MNNQTHSANRSNVVDHTKVTRFLVVALLFVITVGLGHYAVRSGNRLFMLGFLLLPFVLMLMNRPRIALVLAVVLDATAFNIPGVSLGTIGLFAKLLLVGSALLSIMLGQRMWKGESGMEEKKPLLFFTAVILVLMAVHGSGLRVLGSSTWGGMMYVNLIIGMLVFYVLNGLTVSRRHVRWIIWGSLAAGLLGSVLKYIGFAAIEESMTEVGAGRLMYLMPFVYALFPLGLALGKRKGLGVFIVILSFALIALTGFRSRLVEFIMITVGYGFFLSRNKTGYIFTALIAGLLAWGIVVAISGFLPIGMQRAVSFVPGTHVDTATAKDALGSIEWRVEIWQYCWARVPEYLWIGRGSAFNVWEASENLSAVDIQTFSPWFAFQTRSYHSGPLALLLDYGLFGFIAAGWLMTVLFKRFWRNAGAFCRINTFESRYVAALSVTLLWNIFSFYAVYGDIRGFAALIAKAAITVVLCSSVLLFEQKEEGDSLLETDPVDENKLSCARRSLA